MITVNGQFSVEWRPDMTVQDVLDALRFTFPMIVVKVDGRVVRRQDFGVTLVRNGAMMDAIHLTSGG